MDNRLENLEWVTHSENTIHALKTGLKKLDKIVQFDMEGKFVKLFDSLREAKDFTETAVTTKKAVDNYIFCKENECEKINDEYVIPKSKLEQFQQREICKFSLDGKFIEKYVSVAEACRKNKLIVRSLRKSLATNKGTFSGNIWLFADDCEVKNGTYIIKNLKRKEKSSFTESKKIKQYDTNGNFIREFNSLGEANKLCGYGKNTIKESLNGIKQFGHGFIWKYSDETKDDKKSEDIIKLDKEEYPDEECELPIKIKKVKKPSKVNKKNGVNKITN